MPIEMILTDDVATETLPPLEVPLTVTPLDGTQDVQTADNNISTYFTFRKKEWSHTWAYLTEDEFNLLKAFYDRQFNLTILKYPRLSIPYYSVSNVPVRMYLSPQDIIDNCGTVQNVTVTFRESSNGA